MIVSSVKLKFYIPYAASLKDKRQIRQSIIAKTRQKFNAAVAEVDAQDLCQTLVLGVAVVSGDGKHAGQMIDEIIKYIENHTEAELIEIEGE